jgi:ABC-type sugar transport system substrate-binding protein
MKKAFVALLVVVTLLLVSGACLAADGAGQKKYVIGFAAKGLHDPFTSMEASVYQAQAKLPEWADKFDFRLLDCEFNTNKQIEVLENFISMGVDAIICQVDVPTAILPVVEQCEKLGIPVVTDLVLNSDWAYTVESNPMDDGTLLGEYTLKYIKEKGLKDPIMLFMQGEVGNPHANAREEFTNKVLKAAGCEFNATNTGNWFRDQAIALAENWLEIYPKIDVIVCANDDMSLGVVQVLEAAGRLDETMVCSVDALAEAVLSVKKGKLAMTVGKDVFAGCNITFQLVSDLLDGKTPPERVIKVPKDEVSQGSPEVIKKWQDMYTSIGNWTE